MNYAGIDNHYATNEHAKVILRSIPYDGTSTWGKGADRGFAAFLDASANMELFDIETNTEVYKQGVWLAPELSNFSSPEHMAEVVYANTKELLKEDKLLTTFGGEHSISIPILRAFREKYNNLSVLQIDAHADLRPEYEGTKYNHACAVYEASKHSNLVQVGIRSMDSSEMEHVNTKQCFFMHQLKEMENWQQTVSDKLSGPVYITFDLDAFDPAICPGTGTPEPGGLFWYETTQLLRTVFTKHHVVGFDIVELAPIENQKTSEFLAAKLYYKMLTYNFLNAKP